jgi:ribonucleoside-triphosphate reductase
VGELERMFGLAAQAHAEKRRFLENLMECRGLGPMAVLAAQRDGQPLVDLAHGRYLVSLVGLNECVQSVAGAQLHEDRSAADLAERLLTHLGRLCAERGAADDLRLALSASPDEAVAHRFAALDLQERPDETRGVMKTDGVTGDIQYTPGVAVSDNAGLTPLGRALLEGRFHRRLNGPAVTQLRIPASGISAESLAAFLEAACRRTEARALQFTW